MADSCNSSTQTTVFGIFCGSFELWILLSVVSTMLVFSVCWNILCCIATHCTDKGNTFLPRFRRSLSLRLRDMEDNPIYGNISYTQTRVELPLSSSSVRDRPIKSGSQVPSKRQDCYANLTLKAPKMVSGRSSPQPQIEYSDVVTLQGPQEVEKVTVANNNADTVSVLSDLYASVQTDRTKTLDTEAGNDGYANHV
ncbi:uncharacterized protein isoform X1 [Salmo salar]|uniref:Uncharacterized protein isoform X1 n=1 Tax=Salmo salar TaxID=8030 RepID=A0A1S3P5J6_SALSA|nr:uncharacterized protein LOC106583333 isoform X1 [Salmo salar]|eukprot:XP_014022885.1 PREDICTED: uncharacterized protein LOC106583333 [Salmo salar]